jgi:hypothetical protein
MTNPTITTEQLLDITKSAVLLRQTAEQALRCESLARELHSTRTDRDYLAGVLERTHHAFDGDPDDGPEDFSALPKAVEDLMHKCEAIKGEVVTAGNHAACRLNVLRDIFLILGTDGSPNEAMNTVTGVLPQFARLPKRIKQLLADVTTWRERYDKEVCKNGDLVRENETLARNAPPKPPLMEEVTNVDGVVITYNRKDFPAPKLIGQAWCRTENRHPGGCLVLGWGNNAVLCNVHQDVMTGAVTYLPIPFDELPHVSSIAAP